MTIYVQDCGSALWLFFTDHSTVYSVSRFADETNYFPGEKHSTMAEAEFEEMRAYWDWEEEV